MTRTASLKLAKGGLGLVLVMGSAMGAAKAQGTTSSEPPAGAPSFPGETVDRAGCTLDKRIYTCNFGGFRHMFHRAKTIAIEASPRDHAATTQLEELVTALNRSVAAGGQPDLIFSVLPIDHGGVIMGPADTDLASLHVYAGGAEGEHGELLWVETYRGQANRPWPATVHALIAQFQERMKRPKP